MKLVKNDLYLLLIDEEVEIKAGSYYITNLGNIYKETERFFEEDEGVERFSNRSLYKPILAYYPLTKEAKELDLPLLPNPFEEVNIEKLAKEKFPLPFKIHNRGSEQNRRKGNNPIKGFKKWVKAFTEGYKEAQSKGQYSLEDIKKAIEMARDTYWDIDNRGFSSNTEGDWSYKYTEEDIIQSLSTQQLPKKFTPEYESYEVIGERDEDGYPLWSKRLKTITNSEGKEELVGTYKY